MTITIAHLGPNGTYAEQAAQAYVNWLTQGKEQEALLCPYPSIAQTLKAVAKGQALLAVVPVENSIEGSVAVTLDTLWQLDTLQIQLALILPISHALLSHSGSLSGIKTVYSHPQALAQCQGWLEQFLPNVQLIPTNATTEALQHLDRDRTAGAIASLRAAQLYNLPLLATAINDYPDNCTRFWVVSQGAGTKEQRQGRDVVSSKRDSSSRFEARTSRIEGASTLLPGKSYTSLAFSLRANIPGALVKPLQVFAQRGINMSRIESRPTKRSLGDYLFFIDLEGDKSLESVQSALAELTAHTEVLKIFGSYHILGAGG